VQEKQSATGLLDLHEQFALLGETLGFEPPDAAVELV
jgi:hypothetical protein